MGNGVSPIDESALKVLLPFQQRIATSIGQSLKDSDFALAGGAALIMQGLVDRKTNDLDYFGTSTRVLTERLPLAIAQLQRDGLEVETRRQSDTFVRIVVRDGVNEVEVDFGLDGRLFPAVQGEFSPVLTAKELAVDKVLAVFGRAEARDFVDLDALQQHFDLAELFDLASQKDRGFDLKIFAEMTNRVERLDEEEFNLGHAAYRRLVTNVGIWRDRALDVFRGRDRGRGIDL